jgi:hypothetical protein
VPAFAKASAGRPVLREERAFAAQSHLKGGSGILSADVAVKTEETKEAPGEPRQATPERRYPTRRCNPAAVRRRGAANKMAEGIFGGLGPQSRA